MAVGDIMNRILSSVLSAFTRPIFDSPASSGCVPISICEPMLFIISPTGKQNHILPGKDDFGTKTNGILS
mgnify:CR=1 FL=1